MKRRKLMRDLFDALPPVRHEHKRRPDKNPSRVEFRSAMALYAPTKVSRISAIAPRDGER
jgi:hypothetical protein